MRTVYCITKKVPDNNYDVYVGSTSKSLKDRFYIHKYHATLSSNANNKLYKRMTEVGLDKWEIKPLLVLKCNRDEICKFEKSCKEILEADLNTYSPINTTDEDNRYRVRKYNKKVIDDKRHYCDICDKAFSRKGYLHEHYDTLKHQYAYLNSLD